MQIGRSSLMYTGDYDGHFPAHPASGRDWSVLVREGYANDGKVFNCPTRKRPAPGAAQSAYLYKGRGLKDDNVSATTVWFGSDLPTNHPDNWHYYLYIDGHVSGNYRGPITRDR